jgi:hypothetical protein
MRQPQLFALGQILENMKSSMASELGLCHGHLSRGHPDVVAARRSLLSCGNN